ncbi:MAG: asparagine synthase (glutamine-hydrolyzing) [Burkholderiales bacterium]|jgi:asparagine synthase (glutamine-hydrolysing)|nr:asparagine synthase (glutamine-hydrolyzing) [Burkholderiales bacterium]
MCGICGIFDRSGRPVDQRALERMTTALAHRGPDGEGYYLNREIGMGHRRLSIIDVEGGKQPICNEDETLQVVFNGEIYNYVELREELKRFGHQFKTVSDTEVIVHAYEQWGSDCVNHFNGMFAFAIFNTVSRTLFLARDHLGIKPLYATLVGNQVLFASEIGPLLQHPDFRREVDLSALAELFTFRFVPSPKTLFNGIFKLPPAHWMKVDGKDIEIRRFWNDVPKQRTRYSEHDLIEEYQALFEDAVRLQMRSDVPVGLFLSSGVDSGALLAIMSQHSHRPVQTFTIGFEGADRTNELEGARQSALQFGAEHHSMMLSHRDYITYFERYMGDLEEPVAHEPAPAFYFLAQMTSAHVKVALAGQGADEPWAGYDRYLGVKLSSLYSRLPTSLTGLLASLIGRVPLPMERLKRGVASLAEPDVLTRFAKIYSFFSADMKAQLYKGALKVSFDESRYGTKEALRALQSNVDHLDPLSQMLYIDTRANLPDDLLMVADKTSMANSLEVRVPFLDHRLVQFIESLPPGLKLKGMTGKYLHKKAMTKWLPSETVYRKKKGFAHPVANWLRGPMKALVDDCLLSSDSYMPRYFERGYIQQMLKRHEQGREQFMRHIYLLVSLELWHRTFMSK